MSDIKHTLFQRKDTKRWILSYVPHGRTWDNPLQITAPKTVTTKAKAKAWSEGKLGEIRAAGGVLATTKRGADTLRQVHERLMRVRCEHPDVKQSTITNNWSHLRAQILKTQLELKTKEEAAISSRADIADVAMADVDVSRARAFVRFVRARNSPNHTRNIYSTARLMWDLAQGEGIISTLNPFRNQLVINEMPAAQTLHQLGGDFDPITVPMAVAQALLLAEGIVPLERRVRYALACCQGLDDGEIAGLTWGHLHELDAEPSATATPFLEVRQALALRGPGGFASLSTTKTINRNRDVPLHPAVQSALRDWREGWEQFVCRKPQPPDYLFVRADGRPWRPPSALLIRQDMRALNTRELRARREALLGDDELDAIEFKAARRTFSSALKQWNVEPEDRGKLMGHSGATVTARNYTRHELARLASLVARIPLWWAVQNPVRTGREPAQTEDPGSDPKSSENDTRVPEVRMGFEPTYVGFAIEQDPVRGADGNETRADKSAAESQTDVGYADGRGHATQPDSEARTGSGCADVGQRFPKATGCASVPAAGGSESLSATAGDASDSAQNLDSAFVPEPDPGRGTTRGSARVGPGVVGVRVVLKGGRVLARTDIEAGEPVSDVETRLKLAIGQKGGLR